MRAWFHWMAFKRVLRFRIRPVLRMTMVSFLTTLIVALAFWWTMAAWNDLDRMSRDVVMDVFVQDDVADSTIVSYVKSISSLPGVRNTSFDSGDRVWLSYRNRLRVEGNDLDDVVRLPHRVRMSMTTRGTHASRMTETDHLVTMIVGDDLVRVAWSPSYVAQLGQRRFELQFAVIVGAGLFLLLIMISTVYSFRAEVHHAGADLAVGADLGAAPSITALPHFLVCATAAIAGAALASVVIAVAHSLLLAEIHWLASVPMREVLYVVLVVMVALMVEGWLLTYVAARMSARHGKADRAS